MSLLNFIKKLHDKTKNENKTVTISKERENKKLEKECDELDELKKELLRTENRHIYFSLARWR